MPGGDNQLVAQAGADAKIEYRLHILEKKNYTVWKAHMKNIMEAKGLWDAVQSETVATTKETQARALLTSALSDDNQMKVINCDTAHKIWKRLEALYENKTSFEKEHLLSKLHSYKITSASGISNAISDMESIAAKLKLLGEDVSDESLMSAILRALPKSFSTFISIWKGTAKSERTIDNLLSRLMSEMEDQDTEEKALVAGRMRFQKGRRQGRFNNIQGNQGKECHYCKKKGHFKKDCFKLKRDQESSGSTNWRSNGRRNNQGRPQNRSGSRGRFNQGSNGGQIRAGPVTALVASDRVVTTWVVDSGASVHMTPNKHWLDDYRTLEEPVKIGIANQQCIQAVGVGNIHTNHGALLCEVLYVPEASNNLFSESACAQFGIVTETDDKEKRFYKWGKQILTAHNRQGLYLIQFEIGVPREEAFSATSLDGWHQRFGHVSLQTLRKMHQNKVVEGLSISNPIKEKDCYDCVINKCHRAPHPERSTDKAMWPGEVLHIDTVGPIKVESLGGARYFVLAKDEFSGYRLVRFIQHKNEIPDEVKSMISQARLETRFSILKLVTDNGTEFLNHSLQRFLKDKGIIHTTSAAYTPQQNGFIERDNRTIQEAGRTMLNRSGLGQELWAEAINCAVYAMNRTIGTRASKTPIEWWTGIKPNVKNLRIFGQKAVVRIPDSKRSKFDPKGTLMTFVGYTELYNTYRFYDEESSTIVVSCDAKFIDNYDTDEEHDQPEDVKREKELAIRRAKELRISEDIDRSPSITPRKRKRSGSRKQSSTSAESPSSSRMRSSSAEDLSKGIARLSLDEKKPKCTGEPIYGNLEPKSNIPSNLFLTKNKPPEVYQERLRSEKSQPSVKTSKEEAIPMSSEAAKQDIKSSQSGAKPAHQANLSLLEAKDDPGSFKEAMARDDRDEWYAAMLDEINALKHNRVWILVDRPEANVVTNRWVLRIKRKPNGEIDRYRARLVARGFSQIEGIDYNETYAPVVNASTVRLLLAYAAKEGLEMSQFDVKTAFLYGYLDETIYMEQPEGFVEEEGKVCLLQKSLYGLKQAPRQWNKRFTNFLSEFSLELSKNDGCVFYRHDPLCIVAIYVDDGIVFAKDKQEIDKVLKKLREEFEIHSVDSASYLGFQIERPRKHEIILHQSSYVDKIVRKFNMMECKSIDAPISISSAAIDETKISDKVPYREAIGSLMYAATTTRIDIMFAVGKASRRVADPRNQDWKDVKRIFQYLNHHRDLGLAYDNPDQGLVCYCDADFAGDLETSKSTTGLVVLFAGAPVHWRSSRQSLITLSSTEAEVVSLCTAAKDVAWLRKIALELKIINDEPTPIFSDNQSAIKIVSREKSAMRTRHMNAQNAYVLQEIENKNITVHHVKAERQVADMLTKSTTSIKFVQNRNKLMKAFEIALALLTLFVVLSQAMVFDRVTPIIWTMTDKYVEQGTVSYKINLRYTNPCGNLRKVAGELIREKRQAPLPPQATYGRPVSPSSQPVENYPGYNFQEPDESFLVNSPNLAGPMMNAQPGNLAPNHHTQNIAAPGIMEGKPTINDAVNEAIKHCDMMFHEFITKPISETNGMRQPAKSSKPRQKRTIPEILTGFFFSNILDTVLDKFFHKNDDEEKDRVNIIEKKLNALNNELNITELIANATENNIRAMGVVIKYTERKISLMVHVFPDLVFTTEYMVMHMTIIYGHLTRLKYGFRHKRLELYVLTELLNTREFDMLEPNSVRPTKLWSPRENVLEIEFTANRRDPWTFVYRVDAFRYWANLTGTPVLMEYAGDRYLIHNTSANCIKAIDEPVLPYVIASCPVKHLDDRRLATWNKVMRTDNPYEQPANTSVKGSFPYVYVYCFRLNITILGKQYKCPPHVFKLNSTIKWNTTDLDYQPDQLASIESSQMITLTHDVHHTHFINDEHLIDENLAIDEIKRLKLELDKAKRENMAILLPIEGGGLTNNVALRMTITIVVLLLLTIVFILIKKYRKDNTRHHQVLRTVTDGIYGSGTYELVRRTRSNHRTNVTSPAQVNVTLNSPSPPHLPPRNARNSS